MGSIRDMKSENISEEISEADEELNWAAKLGYTISTNRLRELVAEISRRNARNKALDEAGSHLRAKANEMRGDSPSNIADVMARIFEEQATAIEALKGGDA